MNSTFFGKISKINSDNGYGLVTSIDDGTEYYFKTSPLNQNYTVGTDVAFHFEGRGATAIRKIYVNNQGVKFIPRINYYHIHVDIDQFLPEIIDQFNNLGDFEIIISEFPKIIGQSICVETNEKDDIIYAIRKGRQGYTRFVKNRTPVDTNKLTVILKKVAVDQYIIISTFFGVEVGPEPWDDRATEKDIQFWSNHALIYGYEETQPNTEIVNNPYKI